MNIKDLTTRINNLNIAIDEIGDRKMAMTEAYNLSLEDFADFGGNLHLDSCTDLKKDLIALEEVRSNLRSRLAQAYKTLASFHTTVDA